MCLFRVQKVLELGIRASPAHGPLYRSWAQMEYQMGNTAAARRRFEQGLEACPTYTRLYYAYADMEAAMVSYKLRTSLLVVEVPALISCMCFRRFLRRVLLLSGGWSG